MSKKLFFISTLMFALLSIGIKITYAQPCPDSYEPNDSFGQAWSLKTPTTLQSYICHSTDVDYLSFQADAGAPLYLSLYNLPPITLSAFTVPRG